MRFNFPRFTGKAEVPYTPHSAPITNGILRNSKWSTEAERRLRRQENRRRRVTVDEPRFDCSTEAERHLRRQENRRRRATVDDPRFEDLRHHSSSRMPAGVIHAEAGDAWLGDGSDAICWKQGYDDVSICSGEGRAPRPRAGLLLDEKLKTRGRGYADVSADNSDEWPLRMRRSLLVGENPKPRRQYYDDVFSNSMDYDDVSTDSSEGQPLTTHLGLLLDEKLQTRKKGKTKRKGDPKGRGEPTGRAEPNGTCKIKRNSKVGIELSLLIDEKIEAKKRRKFQEDKGRFPEVQGRSPGENVREAITDKVDRGRLAKSKSSTGGLGQGRWGRGGVSDGPEAA